MTNDDTKQDHPGPEWVEYPPLNGQPARFAHPGLEGLTEWFGYEHQDQTRAQAIARCRAISAAALAWERMKEQERYNAQVVLEQMR